MNALIFFENYQNFSCTSGNKCNTLFSDINIRGFLSMAQASNKRKSERFHCFVPIEGKAGSIFESSHSIDISKGGIGFIARQEVPLNKKIAIEIALAPDGESLLVIGKVTWVRQLSDKYRIGIRFSDVRDGSRSRLDRYFRT